MWNKLNKYVNDGQTIVITYQDCAAIEYTRDGDKGHFNVLQKPKGICDNEIISLAVASYSNFGW